MNEMNVNDVKLNVNEVNVNDVDLTSSHDRLAKADLTSAMNVNEVMDRRYPVLIDGEVYRSRREIVEAVWGHDCRYGRVNVTGEGIEVEWQEMNSGRKNSITFTDLCELMEATWRLTDDLGLPQETERTLTEALRISHDDGDVEGVAFFQAQLARLAEVK